jgi:hypothetical protein
VTAFAMLVTQREVPESRAPGSAHGIDYAGVGLLSAGTIAILAGLDLANADGFTSPVILALLCGGAGLLAAFLLTERRLGERALVPAAVLRNRVFAACCATVLLMSRSRRHRAGLPGGRGARPGRLRGDGPLRPGRPALPRAPGRGGASSPGRRLAGPGPWSFPVTPSDRPPATAFPGCARCAVEGNSHPRGAAEANTGRQMR